MYLIYNSYYDACRSMADIIRNDQYGESYPPMMNIPSVQKSIITSTTTDHRIDKMPIRNASSSR